MARRNIFTIYDVMNDKGVFEENPANACSPKYAGPVSYPRMLYHPLGEMRITQKAEIIVTPMGPEKVGQQQELIHAIANDAEEEAALLEKGWHRLPADAIAASGQPRPAVGVAPTSEMKQENDELKKRIAELEALQNRPAISRRSAETVVEA